MREFLSSGGRKSRNEDENNFEPYLKSQALGTGQIQRSLDDCHAEMLPEPTIDVHGQTFKAIFRPGKINEKEVTGLNDRRKQALEFIQQHGKIPTGEYRKMAGIGQLQQDHAGRVLEGDLEFR